MIIQKFQSSYLLVIDRYLNNNYYLMSINKIILFVIIAHLKILLNNHFAKFVKCQTFLKSDKALTNKKDLVIMIKLKNNLL